MLLRRQGGGKKSHARDVAARPIQAGNETQLYWVVTDDEHDRYGAGGSLRSEPRDISACCGDDCHPTHNQIGCQCR